MELPDELSGGMVAKQLNDRCIWVARTQTSEELSLEKL
jgi:hypothetical protein